MHRTYTMTPGDWPTAHPSVIVPDDVPGGPSTSQTIMVASLQRLLSELPANALKNAYRDAVMVDNVLAKETSGGREWAYRQLRRFYALDREHLLFRALRDLWNHDESGQPLLAMLCALARDPVLRASSVVISAASADDTVEPSEFAAVIEEAFPGAYSRSTRKVTAQKVASSWHQSGHLRRVTQRMKVRARAHATPGTAAYALMLGHLQGVRGQALFETLWAGVLDQPTSQAFDLATTASQLGMLELRHAGGVVEVGFSELLRPFDDQRQGRLL